MAYLWRFVAYLIAVGVFAWPLWVALGLLLVVDLARADGWQDLGQCVAGDTEETVARYIADPYDYGGGGEPVYLKCSVGESEAACGARLDDIALQYCTNSRGASVTNADWNGSTFMCFVGSWQNTPPFQLSYQTGKTYCTTPEGPDVECSTLANVNSAGTADNRPDSWVPEDTLCIKTATVGGSSKTLGGPGNQNGCAAFKRADQTWKRLGTTNDREWIVQVQFTGMECDGEPEDLDLNEPANDEERCKTGAGGLEWCENPQDTTGKDCGFFNDKYVCLNSLGTDKCFTQADGSRICAEGAASPPVPDSGTPGQKAAPDDVMEVCTGENACQQINYYNPTTAAGSARDLGQGAQADGSGTVGAGGATIGNGNGTDGEEGESSVSGGASCEAAPTCTGDAIQCAKLNQQWRTRCPEAPTEADALSAIGATDAEKGTAAGPHDGTFSVAEGLDDGIFAITGGACPTAADITVMGQTVEIQQYWDTACQVAAWLAPIVQAMGALFAALLLFRNNLG